MTCGVDILSILTSVFFYEPFLHILSKKNCTWKWNQITVVEQIITVFCSYILRQHPLWFLLKALYECNRCAFTTPNPPATAVTEFDL